MFNFKHVIMSIMESNERIKNEKNINRLEKIINMNLKYKYNTSNPNFLCSLDIFNTDNLIYNKRSHLVELFKDFMLWNYIDEFLRRFYKTKESKERIPTLYLYYKQYLSFFCKPIFISFKYNDIILTGEEKKAKLFYNNYYYKKNKEREDINKDNGILNIEDSNSINNNTSRNSSKEKYMIFSESIRKKIENNYKNNFNFNISFKLSESSIKYRDENSSRIYSNDNSLFSIIDGITLPNKNKKKYRMQETYFINTNKITNQNINNNKNNQLNNVKLVKPKNQNKHHNSITNITKRRDKHNNNSLTLRPNKEKQKLILPSYIDKYQANLKRSRKIKININVNNYIDLNLNGKIEKKKITKLDNLNNFDINKISENHNPQKSRNKIRKTNSCDNKNDKKDQSSIINNKKLTDIDYDHENILKVLNCIKNDKNKNNTKDLLNKEKNLKNKEYSGENINEKNNNLKGKLISNENICKKKSFNDNFMEKEILNKKSFQRHITLSGNEITKITSNKKISKNPSNNNINSCDNNSTKFSYKEVTSRISHFNKNIPKNNFYKFNFNCSNDNTKNSIRHYNNSQEHFLLLSSRATGNKKIEEDSLRHIRTKKSMDNKKFNNNKKIYSFYSQEKQPSNINNKISISSRNAKISSYIKPINNSILINIYNKNKYNEYQIKLKKNSKFPKTSKDDIIHKNKKRNKRKNYSVEGHNASNEANSIDNIDNIYKKYNISKINFDKYMANKKKENLKK